ncbi:MAG: NUDIX hydrolase N-terminal domain-containing protein [Chloroflexota bacterium]|nr:NUDIX hydrolase N-terminal domain-containing protein [Chloroflexota bacterium]
MSPSVAEPSQRLRLWAHELAAMARTGLEYGTDPYDRERYARMAGIADGIAAMTIDADFSPERPYLPDLGYTTPKTGCNVAAFDAQGRLCLIQRADNRRWALPGGFCEVGSTPSENALRELREEAGLEAELDSLVGVYDNNRFNSRSPYHIYTCCFRGRVIGGVPTPSIETLDVRFVAPDSLPTDMSDMQRAMACDATAGLQAARFS